MRCGRLRVSWDHTVDLACRWCAPRKWAEPSSASPLIATRERFSAQAARRTAAAYLLLSLYSRVDVSQASPNIVPNGDFETPAAAGKLPEGWDIVKTTGLVIRTPAIIGGNSNTGGRMGTEGDARRHRMQQVVDTLGGQ